MKIKIIWLLLLVQSIALAQLPKTFYAKDQPTAPDYSLENNWAALPFRIDAADSISQEEKWVSDSVKKVDVFYIYPTMYMGKKVTTWNADINNTELNAKIDAKPIYYQASAFNQTARVYAPRYRQGHLDLYNDTAQLRQAVLDFAYQDVKNAFLYYLENYNQGRPIIIASHSQGTTHSRRLLKEFFDTPQMKEKLVCAYLVGFAVYEENYQILKPCKTPTETNCYVAWASFKNKHKYKGVGYDFLVGNVCTNPISWTSDTLWHKSKSSLLLSIYSGKKYKVQARRKDNLLWVKTKMPYLNLLKNLHFVDFNLFWYNIRENVAQRVATYEKLKINK